MTPASARYQPGKLRTLQTVMGAQIAAPVLLAIIFWFVTKRTTPAPALLAVLLVVAGAGSFATAMLGYRLPPAAVTALSSTTEPATRDSVVVSANQTLLFIRFALLQTAAIIGLVLGIVSNSFWLILIGALITVPRTFAHCYPTARLIQRTEEKFDAQVTQPTELSAILLGPTTY